MSHGPLRALTPAQVLSPQSCPARQKNGLLKFLDGVRDALVDPRWRAGCSDSSIALTVTSGHWGQCLRQASRGGPAAPVRRWRPRQGRSAMGSFLRLHRRSGIRAGPRRVRAAEPRGGVAGSSRRFLPYALARSQGEVTFYEANWPPASSIYPPNEDFLRAFPFASQPGGQRRAPDRAADA